MVSGSRAISGRCMGATAGCGCRSGGIIETIKDGHVVGSANGNISAKMFWRKISFG